jgi:hypothetical protein
MGLIMKIFKCPCCKGKGGYTEAILDFGMGPYYPCEFCKDNTKVGIRLYLLWFWTVTIPEFIRRIQK